MLTATPSPSAHSPFSPCPLRGRFSDGASQLTIRLGGADSSLQLKSLPRCPLRPRQGTNFFFYPLLHGCRPARFGCSSAFPLSPSVTEDYRSRSTSNCSQPPCLPVPPSCSPHSSSSQPARNDTQNWRPSQTLPNDTSKTLGHFLVTLFRAANSAPSFSLSLQVGQTGGSWHNHAGAFS